MLNMYHTSAEHLKMDRKKIHSSQQRKIRKCNEIELRRAGGCLKTICNGKRLMKSGMIQNIL